MRPKGPGTIRFVQGVRRQGFLQHVGELWRRYGDVFEVRLGRRRILFAIDPDAAEWVLVRGRKQYDKGASYDPVRRFLTGQGLVASTGDLWRRQRKLMAPFFTPKGIQTYANLMVRDAADAATRWDMLAARGQVVEMSDEMTAITASIILKSIFSVDTIESIERMRGAVETMIGFANHRLMGIPIPTWVPTPRNRSYFRARNMVHHAITALIADRRAVDPADWPDDLLAKLMRSRDPVTGESMADSLLRDESITLFFAGHETTARTMTFAWYALAANPHVAARLHDELDRVLGQRPPTATDLKRLPYCLNVVKEVLRLYPPAPFFTRDAIGPDRIGQYDVQPGTMVMLSPYYTHRHPGHWRDPEAFDPDRWTREGEGGGRAFQPFGAGPRVCIGNNFSLLESHLLLAILAQRFAPKLQPGYEARWEMQGVLGLAGGLPMSITERPRRTKAQTPPTAHHASRA